MPLLLLPALLLVGLAAPADSLEESVTQFWTALSGGELYQALKWVDPESRDAFIGQQDFRVQDWALEKIEYQNSERAVVHLTVQRFLEAARTFYPVKTRQQWVLRSEGWRLQLGELSAREALAKVYGASPKEVVWPPGVTLQPEIARLPFLNPVQRGRLSLRNGGPLEAEVVQIRYDQSRFRLLDLPGRVEAGSEASLNFEYIGDEQEQELKSAVEVVVDQGDQTTIHSATLLYNHISQAALQILGLSREEARQLKRGEKVRPALKTPDEARELSDPLKGAPLPKKKPGP